MHTETTRVSPAVAAQLDWIMEGSFSPERLQGEQRAQYEAEQRRIEQEWDNQII